MKKLCNPCFALCLASALSSSVRADVVTLTPAADTFIQSNQADSNAGAHPWFDAGLDGGGGLRRGMIRFDLGSVPPGSTITSAVLRLRMTRVPMTGPVHSNFELRRLTTGWNEGAKIGNSGAPATTGEATWNARVHNSLPWTAPGALDDAPGSASASVMVGTTSGTTYSWIGSGVVADIQFWLSNPSLNAGWLLTSTAEASSRSVRGFGSKEDALNIPELEVGFTPPPPPSPAMITHIGFTNAVFATPPVVITNGEVTLTWSGDTNGSFDVLYTTALDTPWKLAVANIRGAVSGSNFFRSLPFLADAEHAANTNLFYRLNSLPPARAGLAVRLEVAATNLVAPTVLTHANDGSQRLFIADQIGHIRIVDSAGNLLTMPFLDISNRMVTLQANYDERGLLGLVFHPGYATNGRFFVYYSAPPTGAPFNNKTVLSEFKVSVADTNLADAASERVLLTIDQPEFNHEGGALAFGPDGFLYIASGDGGGAGDQHGAVGNAQVLTNLLGKILRIDVEGNNSSNGQYGIPNDNPFVNTAGAAPEIFAYGLRNPWRFSFDRGGTRQGFVADVGQNIWEEVNILRKGANYGWRIMESHHGFDPGLASTLNVDIASLDFPIFEYPHGPLGISIIGGYVYRGAGYPELAGKYVFGDFSTAFNTPNGALYYLEETRPGIWERFDFQLHPSGGRLNRFVKGFGEDETGEVYILSSTALGPNGRTGDARRLVRP